MLRKYFVSGLTGRIVLYSWLTSLAVAQSASPNPPAKKALTIEAIFAEGGITGRPPETIQWTPDYTKFTFIQRNDSGEQGELWSVVANTGVKTLQLNQSRRARLAPAATKITDEHELGRITR